VPQTAECLLDAYQVHLRFVTRMALLGGRYVGAERSFSDQAMKVLAVQQPHWFN
jgi:hypothetical protein